MNRTEVTYAVILGSIALAMLDFSIFFLDVDLAFLVHNIFAAVVGVILAYFSFKLLKVANKNKAVHTLSFLIGVYMIAAHITKLVIGKIF